MYNIDWSRDGSEALTAPRVGLPTLDHAIYLISTVKFNLGQLFHLFDEEELMESCYKLYDAQPDISPRMNLCYAHFYFVVALGQALQSQQRREKLPYGYDLFYCTFQNLPTMGVLMQKPVLAIEILCCAALYLHCIDHRHYAYIIVRKLSSNSLCLVTSEHLLVHCS